MADESGAVLPVPSHHFITDMDVAMQLVAPDRSLVVAERTPMVANPAGGARIGVLATLIDAGASDPALAACRPDWTATQDLTVHTTAPLVEGPMVIENRLVRVGKKVIVVASDVYDGHGCADLGELVAGIDAVRSGADGTGLPSVAARGLLAFARIPGRAAPGMGDHDPASWLGQVRRRVPSGPVQGSVLDRMGMRTVDAATGAVELDLTPYVTNSIGTINGGAQALLVEAAAEAMRPGLVASDLQLHYLAQVDTGPARTSTTVLRDAADHSVLAVEVVDAGAENRPLSLTTVTLQRPSP